MIWICGTLRHTWGRLLPPQPPSPPTPYPAELTSSSDSLILKLRYHFNSDEKEKYGLQRAAQVCTTLLSLLLCADDHRLENTTHWQLPPGFTRLKPTYGYTLCMCMIHTIHYTVTKMSELCIYGVRNPWDVVLPNTPQQSYH